MAVVREGVVCDGRLALGRAGGADAAGGLGRGGAGGLGFSVGAANRGSLLIRGMLRSRAPAKRD